MRAMVDSLSCMTRGPELPEETLKIKETIDALRRKRERPLSGATLAALSGIASSTWWRRMEDPSGFTVRELSAVADVLGVPVKALFG